MKELAKRFRKDSRIVSRQIDTEMILVPIRNDVGDLESIYTLNEVGARIWELLDGKKSLSEIAKLLTREFEVSCEEATNDLLEFIHQLQVIGGVVEVDSEQNVATKAGG